MQCRKCLEIKDADLFTWPGRCKACENKKQSEFIKQHRRKPENKEKYYRYAIKSHLKKTYGMTLEEYDLMVEKQDGKCAICKNKEDHNVPGQREHKLSVDHCHITKKIRGLLCRKCNQTLGIFKENIEIFENCIKYLKDNQ